MNRRLMATAIAIVLSIPFLPLLRTAAERLTGEDAPVIVPGQGWTLNNELSAKTEVVDSALILIAFARSLDRVKVYADQQSPVITPSSFDYDTLSRVLTQPHSEFPYLYAVGHSGWTDSSLSISFSYDAHGNRIAINGAANTDTTHGELSGSDTFPLSANMNFLDPKVAAAKQAEAIGYLFGMRFYDASPPRWISYDWNNNRLATFRVAADTGGATFSGWTSVSGDARIWFEPSKQRNADNAPDLLAIGKVRVNFDPNEPVVWPGAAQTVIVTPTAWPSSTFYAWSTDRTPWIPVAPAAGSGNGIVKFEVAANGHAFRWGTITVDGRSLLDLSPLPESTTVHIAGHGISVNPQEDASIGSSGPYTVQFTGLQSTSSAPAATVVISPYVGETGTPPSTSITLAPVFTQQVSRGWYAVDLARAKSIPGQPVQLNYESATGEVRPFTLVPGMEASENIAWIYFRHAGRLSVAASPSMGEATIRDATSGELMHHLGVIASARAVLATKISTDTVVFILWVALICVLRHWSAKLIEKVHPPEREHTRREVRRALWIAHWSGMAMYTVFVVKDLMTELRIVFVI